MKAISIRQPWAALILIGAPVMVSVDNGDGSSRIEWQGQVRRKDMENRSWPLPKNFQLPQRVIVHAASKRDDGALEWLLEKRLVSPMAALMGYSDLALRGVLLGEVDIVACVTASDSPWFTGPYGFVLANPEVYPVPVPYKGTLRFFEVS